MSTQLDLLDAPPLRHPQTNRECLLNGQRVGYHFERAARKTLGLRIGPQGLTVRAPSRLAQAEVEVGCGHDTSPRPPLQTRCA